MPSSKLRCYLASPYGFAESTRSWYAEKLVPLIKKYAIVLDPWSVDVSHIVAASSAERPALWLSLGARHLEVVASADLVVAMLDQEPPDNGTIVEMAWAAAHSIPVIGYRNDLRASGEEGLPYNLMIGAAIAKSDGATVNNLLELEQELQRRTTV